MADKRLDSFFCGCGHPALFKVPGFEPSNP